MYCTQSDVTDHLYTKPHVDYHAGTSICRSSITCTVHLPYFKPEHCICMRRNNWLLKPWTLTMPCPPGKNSDLSQRERVQETHDYKECLIFISMFNAVCGTYMCTLYRVDDLTNTAVRTCKPFCVVHAGPACDEHYPVDTLLLCKPFDPPKPRRRVLRIRWF